METSIFIDELDNPLSPVSSGMGSAADLTAKVHYLARLKNVSPTPQQVSVAVTWAEKCLRDPQAARIDFRNAPITDPATEIIDRILDTFAAIEVMHFVAALIEGQASPDRETIITRAQEAVNRFTGGAPFFRWPEPEETLHLHYRDVPWAPIVTRADDGTITTVYKCNYLLHRNPSDGPALCVKSPDLEIEEYRIEGKLHRDPKAGPALHLKAPGRELIKYALGDQLHRDANEGPAIIEVHADGDGPTGAAYYVHGKLHRDPKQGPAHHCTENNLARTEYAVDGMLHREASDGPALIYTKLDGHRGGVVTCEEYFSHGIRHRPSSEGPALRWVDEAGKCVREIYIEDGIRHRDPKEGPALRSISHDDGLEIFEYEFRGRLHRDEGDGPAVVRRDQVTGVVVDEQYHRDGELHRLHGPAVTTRDATGQVTGEYWYKYGKLHRDPKDGAAAQKLADGIEEVEYLVEGEWHRDEASGPAIFYRNIATGLVLYEGYFQNGKSHRIGGPASVARDANGRITTECWNRDGDTHRDPNDGPAYVWINEETNITRTQYYVEGRLHRDLRAGPAVFYTTAEGVVIEEEYWMDGVHVHGHPPHENSPVPQAFRVPAAPSTQAKYP